MKPIPDFREMLIIEKKVTINVMPRQILSINKFPLSNKIDEYILKIGHKNMHLLNILMELCMNGKVTVDFREYSDRLELVHPNLTITRAQVVFLLDDYIQKLLNSEDDLAGDQITQKVILQPPKISLPARLEGQNFPPEEI